MWVRKKTDKDIIWGKVPFIRLWDGQVLLQRAEGGFNHILGSSNNISSALCMIGGHYLLRLNPMMYSYECQFHRIYIRLQSVCVYRSQNQCRNPHSWHAKSCRVFTSGQVALPCVCRFPRWVDLEDKPTPLALTGINSLALNVCYNQKTIIKCRCLEIFISSSHKIKYKRLCNMVHFCKSWK